MVNTSLLDEGKVRWWSLPFSRAQSRSGLDAPAYNPLKLSQLQKPDCRIAASEAQSYRELGAASSLARLPSPYSSLLLRSRQTQPSAIAYARRTAYGELTVHLPLPAEFTRLELCQVPAVLHNWPGFCPSGRPNVTTQKWSINFSPTLPADRPPHCFYPVFS